ncbi:MAG: DNA gyrase C-terminal beta-propeller domain-containing protein, partial [candidate division WOR-3 bacterium]
SIRFSEEEVRPMGFNAGGVAGIRLVGEDLVTAADVVDVEAEAAVITEQGAGKRTPLSEYPRQGRAGQGVIAIKVAGGDAVAGLAIVGPKDDVIKTWTVTKSFDIGGVSKTFTFTLSRIVTTEPEMKPYIYPKEEQGDHSTWQEGVTITGPTTPVDLGYFTVRATGKFYKAIPPVEITKTVKEPGTGWKRGMTVIRSK